VFSADLSLNVVGGDDRNLPANVRLSLLLTVLKKFMDVTNKHRSFLEVERGRRRVPDPMTSWSWAPITSIQSPQLSLSHQQHDRGECIPGRTILISGHLRRM